MDGGHGLPEVFPGFGLLAEAFQRVSDSFWELVAYGWQKEAVDVTYFVGKVGCFVSKGYV